MAVETTPGGGVTHRQRLGFLLARIGRRVWARLEQTLEPFGLRPRHLVVMMELRDTGPTSQQALLEQLGFDPATLVALLNHLDEKGYVSRRRDPADRRRHIVALTSRGRTQLQNADLALRAAEERLLAALNDRERKHLALALASIERALDADELAG